MAEYRLKITGVHYAANPDSVAGDTFTTQLGSWIYTWSKDGKKISTRYKQ